MKKIFLFLFIIQNSLIIAFSQNVGINTDGSPPHSSAALDIKSYTKGVLIPRLTSGQRSAIVSPATGLLVFDINTNSFWFKGATNWIELADTLNNTWKKNGTNTYLNNSGNAGIGTTTPAYDLHINRTDPSLGFTDEDDNHFSGSITGDSSNLTINAYRKQSFGNNEAGNLILQAGNSGQTAGNVGIGISSPVAKLDVNGSIKINGELNRLNTGAANLTPIAYGTVMSDGTVATGTGNFTVNKNPDFYEVTITGITLSTTDILIVTPRMGVYPKLLNAGLTFPSGHLVVAMWDFITGEFADGWFDFVIYRP